MVDLRPDTASLARASYTWELRGDLAQATDLMQRALADAASAGDRAFARYYLGELAFNAGDVQAALAQYQAGIAADASYVPVLEGRAKAEAAPGQHEAAVADYTQLVARAPQPAYLISFGELLESLGRSAEAQEQYRTLAATTKLFEATERPSTWSRRCSAPTTGTRSKRCERLRPASRAASSLTWSTPMGGRCTSTAVTPKLSNGPPRPGPGRPNALFHYHAGMIRLSLGDIAAARDELTLALAINPHFDPLAAPKARATLDRLEATS